MIEMDGLRQGTSTLSGGCIGRQKARANDKWKKHIGARARYLGKRARRALLDTRRIYRDHDTHEDCENHEVCYTIRSLCAYADLADDELFAYTPVEIL
jgi:hypothetical protein